MPSLEINYSDIFFDPKVQTMCISPSFTCPYYKGGEVKYWKGMLPQTDDILSRAMNISVGVSDAGLGSALSSRSTGHCDRRPLVSCCCREIRARRLAPGRGLRLDPRQFRVWQKLFHRPSQPPATKWSRQGGPSLTDRGRARSYASSTYPRSALSWVR